MPAEAEAARMFHVKHQSGRRNGTCPECPAPASRQHPEVRPSVRSLSRVASVGRTHTAEARAPAPYRPHVFTRRTANRCESTARVD